MSSLLTFGAPPASADSALPGLANPDQVAIDSEAAHLIQAPEVLAEKDRIKALYQADKQGQTKDGAGRIDSAVTTMAIASALNVVGGDPDRPRVMWDSAALHRWGEVVVPPSGYGFDNPDNVYRQIPIDGAARYEITGQVPASGGPQQSFTLYRSLPGGPASQPGPDGRPAAREGSPVLGTLMTRDLVIGPDGRFTITIDADPAVGRTNHLQSAGNPDALLIVRDTLADWATETPNRLSVRRTAGPPAKPALDEADKARRTIELMQSMAPFWIRYMNDYVFDVVAPNSIQKPQPRDGGWGFAAYGRFDLADDEALVVTINPIPARYTGFQVTDCWSMAPDYVHHQASLNGHQTVPDADGATTYVLSPFDPGVANWIDTVGMQSGALAVRWQDLPSKSVSADHAIRSVRVMKRDALGSLRAVARVTPEGRRKQLAERATQYERRIAE